MQASQCPIITDGKLNGGYMRILMLFIALGFIGCASTRTDMKKKYSEEDLELINPHFEKYVKIMSRSIGLTAMSPGFAARRPDSQTQDKMSIVFCNCVRELGAKSCESLSSVGVKDKALWAKARAAKEVAETYSGPMWGMQSGADADFCVR